MVFFLDTILSRFVLSNTIGPLRSRKQVRSPITELRLIFGLCLVFTTPIGGLSYVYWNFICYDLYE